jgi:galactokinase
MSAGAVAQRVTYTGDAMSPEQTVVALAFESAFGRPPAVVSEAPGRVNLIGEHTDYNEGFVLPMAIDRRVVVAAAPRDDRKVRVYSRQFEARDEWQVDAPRRTGRVEWRDYVRGVAWALLDAGFDLCGADLLIDGDVPVGAGLSSSAALELAVAGALCSVAAIETDPTRLAILCQKAENDFVGVQCGVMDQLASALGRTGHGLLIDCRSLVVEHVPLPLEMHGLSLLIIDSRVPRRLAETPYNQRREECAAAARAIGVPSLRDATAQVAEGLPEPLSRRARHVISENQRVLDADAALRAGDMQRCGELMCRSHESLRDDFEVSCRELDLLFDIASACPGVLGARMTGAGFGGCTVNLVRSDAVERFRVAVGGDYHRETGLDPCVYVCTPSNGLQVMNV